MSSICYLYNQIAVYNAQLGRGPELTPDIIRHSTSGLPGKLAHDIVELYACAGGGQNELEYGLYWLTIEGAIDYYKEMQALENYVIINYQWDKSLFPFMIDGSGDALCTVLSNEQRDFNNIVRFNNDGATVIEYTSVEQMLTFTLECYKRGIFVYDSEKEGINVDLPGWRSLASELNVPGPNSNLVYSSS